MNINIDARLAQNYMQMIDPSGNRPIAVAAIRPACQDIVEHSRDVVAYFLKKDPTRSMFIIPAPRRNHTARLTKGSAWGSHVAWVDFDIDGQYNTTGYKLNVPAELREHLILYRSGRSENYHVYLPFSDPVRWRDLTLINWMLDRVLHGDRKFTDNQWLRLPGSINAKNGRQVIPEPPIRTPVPVAPMMAVRVLAGLLGMDKGALRVRRDVLADGGSRTSGFTVVDVDDEDPRFTWMHNHPDPTTRRYMRTTLTGLRLGEVPVKGSRHGARQGFWRDFYKAGFTCDETYSLMLKHEVDIERDDQNVDHWELDLARCWRKYETESA
jgi:hypothetical protein